jgi:hypothetical protein
MINEIVAIKHYSYKYPVKTTVLSMVGNILTVMWVREFEAMNIMEFDPLVIIFKTDFIGGIVENTRKKCFRIQVDNIKSQKTPVSIYADDYESKKIVLIKYISMNDLKIISEFDYLLGNRLKLFVYAEKRVIFLNTTITSKINKIKFIEYSLTINYENYSEIILLKEYISYLNNVNEDFVLKIKNNLDFPKTTLEKS